MTLHLDLDKVIQLRLGIGNQRLTVDHSVEGTQDASDYLFGSVGLGSTLDVLLEDGANCGEDLVHVRGDHDTGFVRELNQHVKVQHDAVGVSVRRTVHTDVLD